MTDNTHKTFRTILYFGMAVMAYLLIRGAINKPSEPQSVTITKDTTKPVQIIIQGDSWKPTTVIPASSPPYIPLNYDSLASAFMNLYSEHHSANTYDTTLTDSVSIERLQLSISQNKLQRFTRDLQVIQHNTTTIRQQAFAIYGGLGIYTTEKMNPYITASLQTKGGYLYSLGKGIDKGFIFSVQGPIFRRYK